MKTVIRNSIKLISIGTLALILSACGTDENFGIDHGGGQVANLPNCTDTTTSDANLSGAIVVPPNTKVVKNSADAQIRVWHFQNSVEAVCMLKGEALFQPIN